MSNTTIDLIVDMRENQTLGWHEIGGRLGMSADAARKRYTKHRRREEVSDNPGLVEVAKKMGVDPADVSHAWLKSSEGTLAVRGAKIEKQDDGLETFTQRLCDALSALPAASPTLPPKDAPSDVQARYIVADLHGGMAANMAVSGADFDLDLCASRLIEATRRLVAQTMPTETAVVANLGDMFHANDSKKMTFHSGHILDMVKEAYPEIAYRVTMAMVSMIDLLLTQHQTVIYRGVPGNHDVDQFFWLTIAIKMHYRNESRVVVELTQGKLIVDVFGRTMTACHHGDRTTFQRLVNLISDQYAPEWGQTHWRYLDTGHVHHDRAEDIGGMHCESHRNLPPPDAAAHGFGYWNRSTAKSIVVHKDRGEIDRHTVGFG